jgi:hypothetical protein
MNFSQKVGNVLIKRFESKLNAFSIRSLYAFAATFLTLVFRNRSHPASEYTDRPPASNSNFVL